MKKIIEEINLILKIHRTLGLLSSLVAVCCICYLLIVGSFSLSQLNIN
jgi:hypothetical protein